MKRPILRQKRCILLLLDGVGDRAHPVLGNRTPLQAARTPNLDSLAACGANGIFHADTYGAVLPSENAHFAIFGYASEEFPGRGFLEARGADIPVAADEVALLAHFASLEQDGDILVLAEDRPATVDQAEAAAFAALLADRNVQGITFSFAQTKRLDGILKLKGEVSPWITDSDCFVEGQPLIEILPLAECDDPVLAAATAKALKTYLVQEYSRMCRHPLNMERRRRGERQINGLVVQRPGMARQVTSFSERWGLRGASIASGLMYWGLASFLGMDCRKVKDGSDAGADIAERLRWAVEAGDDYDFIHVHTKAPDAAAHTKIPEAKVNILEALDRGVGAVMEDLRREDIVLVITGDHSTPSSGPLVHSGEPVPITVIGQGIRQDRVEHFDEVSCATGSLGQLRHGDFMHCVLNWLDRAKLRGLMDSPQDLPYWPGKRRHFRISEVDDE